MTLNHDEFGDELQRLADTEANVDHTSCLLRVERPGVGVWSVAAGPIERGGAAASPTSPFRTASITKSFTGVVVLQLVQEGRLALDDLMTAHLPDDLLPVVPRLHVIDGVSYGERITIRQLLTHSSGLFDYEIGRAHV